MALFQEEMLNFESLSESIQGVILRANEIATAAKARRITNTHLLLALIETLDDLTAVSFEEGLEEGVQASNIQETLQISIRPRHNAPSSPPFSGARMDFSEAVQTAFEQLERLSTGEVDGLEGFEDIPPLPLNTLPLPYLWLGVLNNPEPTDRDSLSEIYAFDRAVQAFAEILRSSQETLPPLYDQASDPALLMDRFSESAIEVLGRAGEIAGEMGYKRIMPAHLLMAVIAVPDGVGDWLVRRQAKPDVNPARVIHEIERNISLGFKGKGAPLGLSQMYFSVAMQQSLEEAQRKASRRRASLIGEAHLAWGALHLEREGRIASTLNAPTLQIDIDKMIRNLDQYLRSPDRDKEAETIPFLLPPTVLKSEDLTYLARVGKLSPTVALNPQPGEKDSPLDQIKRTLHKREDNHVLITGLSGVGKTALVNELARQIAAGEIPFLSRKKIVWADCSQITPEESRERLEKVVSSVKGRNDVILCLDNLEALLRFSGQREASNLPLLRTAVQSQHVHLIALIQDRYFSELLSNEYQFLKHFTRIEVREPDPKTTESILNILKPSLESTYGVRIADQAVKRAIILSRDFILSERLPAKALQLIKDGCERALYERRQKPSDNSAQPLVNADQVIAVVNQKTGIPESALRGVGDTDQFEALLKEQVMGQDEVIEAVVHELKLIRGGFKDPTKPASVLFFAGITGTGKTELAKAIARLYAGSKNLTVYSMGNFTEGHSVSGIVGVPPGYVGYEAGGRLINDLNTDPYSVILLDEADKAHPDLWKPFLNLFDEAWITDQRNVKAYGNRAIFILTSNAGAKVLYDKTVRGESNEAITEAVIKAIRETRHDKTGGPCFSPEFLARITRMLIFKPLTAQTMREIAAKKIHELQETWRDKREKTLNVTPAVIDAIGSRSFEAYERSFGEVGGREVIKNIAEWVDAPLQRMIAANPEVYRRSRMVRVDWVANKIVTAFEDRYADTPPAIRSTAVQTLDRILNENTPSPLRTKMARIDHALKQWQLQIEAWAEAHRQPPDEGEISRLWALFGEIQSELQAQEQAWVNQLEDRLQYLLDALREQTFATSREER